MKHLRCVVCKNSVCYHYKLTQTLRNKRKMRASTLYLVLSVAVMVASSLPVSRIGDDLPLLAFRLDDLQCG